MENKPRHAAHAKKRNASDAPAKRTASAAHSGPQVDPAADPDSSPQVDPAAVSDSGLREASVEERGEFTAASEGQDDFGAYGGVQDDFSFSEPRVRPVAVSHKGRARKKAAKRNSAVVAKGASSTVRAAQSKRRKRNPIGVFFRFVGSVIAIAALAVIAVGGTLAITEFRPHAIEPVEVLEPVDTVVQSGEQISLLTWNIGYAGLPAEADSFIDGGSGVRAESKEAVEGNLEAIESVLVDQYVDIVLLQEVDKASDRSFQVNEVAWLGDALTESGYSNAFAKDHGVMYVPYPWPCLGKVESGLVTASGFSVRHAERVALEKGDDWLRDLIAPEPCLLLSEYSIEGSRKKLIVMNVRFSDRVDQDVQDAQAKELALFMKREADKGNYVIVGGDFGQSFSETDVSQYAGEASGTKPAGVLDQGVFADYLQFAMDASTPTARSLNAPLEGEGDNVCFYVTDGFIVSSNVQIDLIQTVDTGFQESDHNPVRLEVTLA